MDKSVDLLGVKFNNISLEKAVLKAMDHIKSRSKGYVVTPNPEIVWNCRKNNQLLNAVNDAFMVLADGIGIIYGAKILKTPMVSRVTGMDFGEGVIEQLSKIGGSIYLFGAKEGTAKLAGEKLVEKHPGLVIAGSHHGYFDDDSVVIDDINRCRPDFLLICLGSPKQELWAAEHIEKLDVGLAACLGGALDVFAGNVRRAPVFMQKLGLEWFYRLIREPRRILRMASLPKFILTVIWRRFNG